MLDLIIVGAGPSGITAAVYAARAGLDFIVMTIDIGGQAAWSGNIENYTGYQFVSGPELVSKFEEHMKNYGINLHEGEAVIEIKKEENGFIVKTGKGDYKSRSVIIASGKKSKELNVPGENEFKNRGVTYCATCDGPLFKAKDVAIIGGGNSALDASLQMIKIAKHVYIVNIEDELKGDSIMREKISGSPNVTLLNNSSVTEIAGRSMVDSIKVKDNKTSIQKNINVSGVFIEIGLIPNSGFAADIEKNEKNEIVVDSYNRTNVKGVFAAGDVTNIPEKQIVIAAGEGAKALLGVFKYIQTVNP